MLSYITLWVRAFCELIGVDDITEELLNKIENKMKEVVKQDLLFNKMSIPLDEARKYLKKMEWMIRETYLNIEDLLWLIYMNWVELKITFMDIWCLVRDF